MHARYVMDPTQNHHVHMCALSWVYMLLHIFYMYTVIQSYLPKKLHQPQPLVIVEGILESPSAPWASGCYIMAEGTATQGKVKSIVTMLLASYSVFNIHYPPWLGNFRNTFIEADSKCPSPFQMSCHNWILVQLCIIIVPLYNCNNAWHCQNLLFVVKIGSVYSTLTTCEYARHSQLLEYKSPHCTVLFTRVCSEHRKGVPFGTLQAHLSRCAKDVCSPLGCNLLFS